MGANGAGDGGDRVNAVEGVAEERAMARPTPSTAPAALPASVALATVALTYWTIDILAPALPAIQDDLGLSAAGAGLVFSLLFLGRLFGNFPAAFLVDRLGTSLTTALGGALLTAGSLLAAIAAERAAALPGAARAGRRHRAARQRRAALGARSPNRGAGRR